MSVELNSDRYYKISPTAERVKELMETRVKNYLFDLDAGELSRSSESWRMKIRVKSRESVSRKCQEVGIAEENFLEGIEDFIGLRIITKNKTEAKALYEKMYDDFLVGGEEICKTQGQIQGEVKTFDSAKEYSILSGYQAYHINFIFDSERRYENDTSTNLWPVEIQVMSELWHFYAEFSRKYFYKPDDPAPDHLKQYLSPLSRILDAADDLVSNILVAKQEHEKRTEEQLDGHEPSIQEMKEWLSSENRLENLFGTNNMPDDIFLLKSLNLLSEFEIDFERLENILSKDENKEHYAEFIAASPGLYFLPPWQKILMFVLLDSGESKDTIIEKVNDEIWHRSLELRAPPKGIRKGMVMGYDEDEDKGFVVDIDSRIVYFFSKADFSRDVSVDEIGTLMSNKNQVQFTLRLSTNKNYYDIESIEV